MQGFPDYALLHPGYRLEYFTTKDTKGTKEEKSDSEYLAQRRKGDGPRPVIPSECEGSKKDFSRSLP
jgi:hypothetical protein